ncbi:MAG: O-antigen ligase family protein [Bacteroidales bacterium]|nr:O-antigen ligase family protein [Bacteroidales bacterium]
MLFTLLCGCSILWATNTAEAVFAFSTQLLSPLIIIVFYGLLSTKKQLTQKALWISAATVLAVYLFFTLVQLFHVESFSFDQLYRVSGLSGHKNLLAVMLFVLSGFLLTSFAIFENKVLRWLSAVVFAIAFIVIFLLKSRAVLLGVLVAGGCFGMMMLLRTRCCNEARRSHLLLVMSIIVVYVFLTVGLRVFADRSVPHTAEKSEIEHKMLSTSSLAERCLLWEKTYHVVDNHPFMGCGIGNWQIHFPDAGLDGLYRADVWNVNFTKPHNEYLGILAETGYLGLLLYVAFLTSIIVLSFFALLRTENRKDFLYGAIILSLFVGCCVNALFDFPNSRIEHVIWMGILIANLLKTIANGQQKTLGMGWNMAFMAVAVGLVVVGAFRLKGERNTFMMQQALKANDWKAVERYGNQAFSFFYTIDPVGLPLHWYIGKAEKQTGNPKAIDDFRRAYHYAPFCKENLNDLGLAEYYASHDLKKAEFYLNEAIRISPNYLYPSLNLAYIYLSENQPQKAKAVADAIYFDEHKRDVLKTDAAFFEPFNAEAIRHKIDADYEAVMQLRKTINDKSQSHPMDE